ncbi:MDR/zinc-dependent alcohol dehydrogenase-like family protein [Streptantibioticus ferralitis]|uniref:Medium chain dehydrogenase/reductase family protein n=1 Tax=Streptantibioticus ferralitis TaxID=236510 RepID=A0ABT5YYW7_9ACTN|nr:medium chain dehydrogenase/reductase family protein [Streptantibioticus ferralitis]MDF2256789.1 medium chain dehydrogenase/reductase family protein [Streptantibioticus ferralitis]
MKAAVLKQFGSSLTVQTVPSPVLGTGEVVVDVVAAGVLPYAAEVFSGERQYLLTLPVTPGAGAVGRVRAVGPDSTRLTVGDWVLCDPTVRSRDDALTPDITLQGLSARGQGGLRLQEHFGQGSFAEQLLAPTENVFPIGAIEPGDAGAWCALSLLLVPYGGLLAAGLQAGQTVLISGATGHFGSAAVAVALAMGAGSVITPGRNEKMLDELQRRFGSRIRTVRLSGEEDADRERMRGAAPGPIDAVLDLLPPSAGTTPVRAAAMTVREYGTVVLMGGVGMLGGDDLGLPYPWIMRNNITIRGQWMYPREAITRLIQLTRSGQLDLRQFDITAFDLDDANAAVAHAATDGRHFSLTVIQPTTPR